MDCFFQFGCFYNKQSACHFQHKKQIKQEEHVNELKKKIIITEKKLIKLQSALRITQAWKCSQEVDITTNDETSDSDVDSNAQNYVKKIQKMRNKNKPNPKNNQKNIATQTVQEESKTKAKQKNDQHKTTETKTIPEKSNLNKTFTCSTSATQASATPTLSHESNEMNVTEKKDESVVERCDSMLDTIEALNETINSMKSDLDKTNQEKSEAIPINKSTKSTKNLRKKIRKTLNGIPTETPNFY